MATTRTPFIAASHARAMLMHRGMQLAGAALGLAGLVLLAALASYNPHDPSLDTASNLPPTNLAGAAGAMCADVLLQYAGLAGGLPAIALMAWGWRVASGRGLGGVATRLAATALAMAPLAALLAGLPAALPGLGGAWPVEAGPGGALGWSLGSMAGATAGGLLGPVGLGAAWVLGLLATAGLAWVGFGLSPGEWRAAGQGAAGAVRYAAGGRSRAARLLRRLRERRHPDPPAGNRFAPGMEDELYALRASEPGPVRPPASLPPVAPPAATVAASAAAAPRIAAPRPPPDPAEPARPPAAEGPWRLPPLALLKPPPARAEAGPSNEAMQANARLLITVLGDFGVQGAIREIHPGPVVTLYELEPAPGIRSSRVIGLADDVARSLSVISVRIATVPGRNVIGIEVPNETRETVFLSELLGSAAMADSAGRLPLALGKDIGGSPVVVDLAKMPHLLIAGTTGSGKSVGVNAMILSLLYRLSPEQCRLIMIDPKMLELSVYDGIPHLMAPVVTEPQKAISALKWTVREMERRYRAMSQLGVRNIGGYNDRVEEAQSRGEVVTRRVQTGFDEDTNRPVFEEQPLALEKLPFIVVVIDEVADLMMVAGKEIEAAVQRLAQMARAAGIHVIMATQRPSVDVITGTIKANFPTRISFQVISKFDSRTILGEQGAEQLLGQGDMLYMAGGSRIVRVHGPFVADREVEEIVTFLRAQGEPDYMDEVTETPDEDGGGGAQYGGGGSGGDSERSLFDQAVDLVSREGKASTSFIQRHLSIGYNRAAKLIEQMEKAGIVSQANHVGKREVLAPRRED